MTDAEILRKATIKANHNSRFNEHGKKHMWIVNYPFEGRGYYGLIFSHDFAKAFWGEEESYMCIEDNLPIDYCPAWKHHLQQMVLEENPIRYLEQFLVKEANE